MSKKGLVLLLAGAALFFSGVASAAWFTDTVVKVRKYLTVGTTSKLGKATVRNYAAADDVLHLRAASAQSADLIDMTDSAGTTVAKFASDGDLTGVDAAFSGAVTVDGSLQPDQVTADPCTGAGYGPGSMFYNATSNYMCFCDGSTDDLKMNDNSTACF